MIKPKPITILVADDDPDDRLLIYDAIRENHPQSEIYFVEDGEELLEYLRLENRYIGGAPHPKLILLDLNMPRKSGREVLRELKADPDLRRIPVVVFTTSSAEQDIVGSYDLGANSFITKPVSYEGLVKVVRSLENYWFETVRLPAGSLEGHE